LRSQDKIKPKNDKTLIACSYVNKLKMASLKARIIILICHIEGMFHKLIRNQAVEYIENSLFSALPTTEEKLLLSRCMQPLHRKMLTKAKDDSLCRILGLRHSALGNINISAPI